MRNFIALLSFLVLAAPFPARAQIHLVALHSIHVARGDLKSVRFSPDGGRVYVENLEGRRTLIYDAHTCALLHQILHVGKPVETAFTAGGRYVWISYLRLLLPGYPAEVPDETKYRYASDVAVYDALRNVIVKRVRVGIMPKFMAVSPDGRCVAVSNWISDTVSLIDTARLAVVATVKVGHVPRGLAFTPDGASLWVANFRGASMSCIDVASRQVVETLSDVGDQPRHIVITPDGKTLYLSTNRDGYIRKYSLEGEPHRLASTFAGKEARTVAMTPDCRYLFVACFTSGTVVCLDAASLRVLSRTPVGFGAVGCDVSPDGRTLWVVSQPTRTIHVFRISE